MLNFSSKVSNAITYGKNTARGEFDTEETIKAIQLKDVQDAYNKYLLQTMLSGCSWRY
jgi:predicted Zn-dependent peptidase